MRLANVPRRARLCYACPVRLSLCNSAFLLFLSVRRVRAGRDGARRRRRRQRAHCVRAHGRRRRPVRHRRRHGRRDGARDAGRTPCRLHAAGHRHRPGRGASLRRSSGAGQLLVGRNFRFPELPACVASADAHLGEHAGWNARRERSGGVAATRRHAHLRDRGRKRGSRVQRGAERGREGARAARPGDDGELHAVDRGQSRVLFCPILQTF